MKTACKLTFDRRPVTFDGLIKGERSLTTAHLKALRERFGTSADLFIQ